MKLTLRNTARAFFARYGLPGYRTPTSAGPAVRACVIEPLNVRAGSNVIVPTGVYVEEVGVDNLLTMLTSPTLGKGVTVLLDGAALRHDFSGEVRVVVVAQGAGLIIRPGDLLGELVTVPIVRPPVTIEFDGDCDELAPQAEEQKTANRIFMCRVPDHHVTRDAHECAKLVERYNANRPEVIEWSPAGKLTDFSVAERGHELCVGGKLTTDAPDRVDLFARVVVNEDQYDLELVPVVTYPALFPVVTNDSNATMAEYLKTEPMVAMPDGTPFMKVVNVRFASKQPVEGYPCVMVSGVLRGGTLPEGHGLAITPMGEPDLPFVISVVAFG